MSNSSTLDNDSLMQDRTESNEPLSETNGSVTETTAAAAAAAPSLISNSHTESSTDQSRTTNRTNIPDIQQQQVCRKEAYS